MSDGNEPHFAINLFNQLDEVFINNKIITKKAKYIRSLYHLMSDTNKVYYKSIF